MTVIYLIRHAQAEGNLFRVMQGHWDGNVTALGHRQIDALAQRMRDVAIDAVYSSDLKRTRLTAAAITRTHPIELTLDKRLREIDVGPFEARAFGTVTHEFPDDIDRFIHVPAKFRVDGAETFDAVAARSYAALVEIAQKHDGQAVAVVSHGITIRALCSRLIGDDSYMSLPTCANTAVTTIEYDNGAFTVTDYNSTSHIDTPELNGGRFILPRPDELRYEYFDPSADRRYYTDCYESSWLAAHGSLCGFTPESYFYMARQHYAHDNRSILRVFDGNTPAGLIELDTRRGTADGYGWLTLLYLHPEYRGRGNGIQLLGQAIVYYQILGRKSLRLHCADSNTAAMKFYDKWGFERLGSEKNALGTLWLLEKKI